MTGHLIPIATLTLQGGAVQTVNARDLHSFLGAGKDFSAWIKGRIEPYRFKQETDFTMEITAPQNGGAGKRGKRLDYHLSLDMAKELSMVERNEKGRETRRHFIDCERRAKEKASHLPAVDLSAFNIPKTLPGALRPAADQQDQIDEQKQQIADMAPKAEGFERIAQANGSLCVTAAAKSLQMRPKDLFDWLSHNGWIYKRPGNAAWLGYQSKTAQGLLEHKTHNRLSRRRQRESY